MEVKEVSINYTLNRPVLIEDTINFCKLAKKKIQTLNLEEIPKTPNRQNNILFT